MIIYRAENLKAYLSFYVFMEAPVMIIDINATQKTWTTEKYILSC